MFRFGMFALEQFKERLHEWPQYCSHIVQISHLREGYAALVGEIEDVSTSDSFSAPSSSNTQAFGPGGGVSRPGSSSVGGGGDTTASGSASGSGGNNVALSSGSVLGGEISVPSGGIAMGGFGSAGTSAASTFTALKPSSSAGMGPTKIELPAPTIPLNKELIKPRKAVFGPGLGRAVNAPAPPSSSESSGGTSQSGTTTAS